jgi:hypothetical protein
MILVRSGIPNDLETIYRFDHSAQSDLLRGEYIRAAIERRECWVVEREGSPVAYGLMNCSFFGRGFVSLMYVQAAHRRNGIAGLLFDEFEAQCSTERIFTATNQSNKPMRALLAGRKYELSGEVRDLDQGDLELIYSKQLR